jgi:uncharacterized membrane protein YhaH (DUF805 family)
MMIARQQKTFNLKYFRLKTKINQSDYFDFSACFCILGIPKKTENIMVPTPPVPPIPTKFDVPVSDVEVLVFPFSVTFIVVFVLPLKVAPKP